MQTRLRRGTLKGMHPNPLAYHLKRAVWLSSLVPSLAACGARVDDVATTTDTGKQPNDSGLTLKDTQPPNDTATQDVAIVTDTPTNSCAPVFTKGSCKPSIDYPCGLPFERDDAGQISNEKCAQLCAAVSPNAQYDSCFFEFAQQDAGVRMYCNSCAVPGRRPDGLQGAAYTNSNAVGDYLARSAYFEAASVDAFERMYIELSAFGAPDEILLQVRTALLDEVRHARIMQGFAKDFGATMPALALSPMQPRSLEAIAIDNVREGCVRETFAAALAFAQAEKAESTLQRAYGSIAEDESNHASLSWQLHAWFMSKLDDEARARVQEAKLEAMHALENELVHETAPSLQRVLGLPSAAQNQAIFASLKTSIWQA